VLEAQAAIVDSRSERTAGCRGEGRCECFGRVCGRRRDGAPGFAGELLNRHWKVWIRGRNGARYVHRVAVDHDRRARKGDIVRKGILGTGDRRREEGKKGAGKQDPPHVREDKRWSGR
jgi:hypothetical protein